ncbi:BfmA/BtgA family mobilization protein [Flavobacterium sp. UGB4466]|uniref:BfmA/BtgA family mobilization protein n=1 Tax=Flavobacterium sp. UGB4466 TaxID=2730889 RepID=UPI00192AE787|nr:BfmA/BtgA family mobilization protein [Flavobacterium sp. UGB4466]
MKERDTNSIRYPKETDDKIQKLSKSLGRSKKELFCQMADYFYRSKKDPADPGDEMLKRELSSGISRILSFIRQQEKDFLLPLFTDSANLKTVSSRQMEILEGIGRHLLAESEKTTVLTKRSEQILNGLKHLASVHKEKELLKVQFGQLLDYYINQREEMGWTTAGTKKEELIAHVRQSLKNL